MQKILFFLIVLFLIFSCSYKEKPVYEKSVEILNSSDPDKYLKAFRMLDTITYPSNEYNFKNMYAEKAKEMMEKIKEEYARVKKEEILRDYANTKIAYVKKDGDNRPLYLMNIDGSNNQKLTDSEFSCDSPRWSNDGKYIAFSSRYEMYIINLDNLKIEKIRSYESGSKFLNPDWSPDGSKLLYSDEYGKIFIYDMKTKKTTTPDIGEYDGTLTSSIWLQNNRDILVFGWGKLLLLKDGSNELVPYEAALPDTEPIITTMNNLYAGKIFSHGILSRDGSKLLVYNNFSMIIDLQKNTVVEAGRSPRSSWSPDSKYVMDTDGDWLIFIDTPILENHLEYIIISDIKATYVAWSPWLKK